MLIASFISLGFGVWGVSSIRDFGVRNAGVQIPLSWYWVAALPPLLIAVFAVVLPQHIVCWRRGLIPNLLTFVCSVSLLSGPLLYIIYDFERRLTNSPTYQQTTP